MLCPNCNHEAPSTFKFCPNCGAELSDSAVIVKEFEPVILREESPRFIPQSNEGSNKMKIISLLIGIVGLALTILAIPVNLLGVISVFFTLMAYVIAGFGMLVSLVGLIVGIKNKKRGGSLLPAVLSILGLVIGILYLAVHIVIGVVSVIGGSFLFFLIILIALLGA